MEMQNELIDLIDQIDNQSVIAEMDVCNSLFNSYTKSLMILENMNDSSNLDVFEIFQENAFTDAVKTAKGDKSENIIIRILKFIPRLIVAFIKNCKSSKKTIEKKIKEVESIKDDLVDTIENPEAHAVSNNKNIPAAEKRKKEFFDYVDKHGDEIVENMKKNIPEHLKKKDQEKPGPGVPVGTPYGGTDDNRKRAEKGRLASKLKKVGKDTIFFLPMKDNWDREYKFYANGDIRIKINDAVLTFVRRLNKDNCDFGAVMEPLTSALDNITLALGEPIDDKSDKEQAKEQKYQRGDLLFNINRRRNEFNFSGILTKIRSNLSESEKALKVIKETEKLGINGHGALTEAMLSDIIRQYNRSLEWMKYMEHVLKLTSGNINRAIKNIDNVNAKSTTYLNENNIDYKATITADQKSSLIACVRKTQTLMTDAEATYGRIIQMTYKHLDDMYYELLRIAREANIIVDKDRVKKRFGGEFFGFGDIVGNVDGGYMTERKKIMD